MMMCQIAEREVSVGELTEICGLSQSAGLQHLARLRKQGIVSMRGEAKTRYSSLSDSKMRRVVAALCQACRSVSPAPHNAIGHFAGLMQINVPRY